MSSGQDWYYTDPTQHLEAAGYDISVDDLSVQRAKQATSHSTLVRNTYNRTRHIAYQVRHMPDQIWLLL